MRKPAIIFALVVLAVLISNGQQFNYSLNNESQGEEFYLNGTRLVELGNYREADSLLTLALCTFKNEDVYFNRAISRLYNYDTAGSCEDLNIAANKYFDTDASRLFNTHCCYKVDSIYYDRKFVKTSAANFRYLEEVQYLKTSGDITGVVHERNAKNPALCLDLGCSDDILGMRELTTDVIAVYLLIDSTKYFLNTPVPPIIERINQYKELKEKAGLYYAVKYKALKELNRLENIAIFYQIRISDKGEVIDGEFLNVFPKVPVTGFEKDLENDIQDVIRRYPKVKPARFMGSNVGFISYDAIDF